MEVPPGYGENINTKTVYKLKKAFYGLEQSPWGWFERFARVMMVMMIHTKLRGSYTIY